MIGAGKVKGFRMVELEERESLLRSLKGYLADLAESGVDELVFSSQPAAEPDCRMEGDPRARLLFVMTGSGFAGEAGGLLEKIVLAMGFAREEICLLSIGSCPDGAQAAWRGFIAERIAAVGPEVVVALGEQSAKLLLPSEQALERMRGRLHDFNGIPVMPSYHPDAMLANEALKRDVWNDMKQVMTHLGRVR